MEKGKNHPIHANPPKMILSMGFSKGFPLPLVHSSLLLQPPLVPGNCVKLLKQIRDRKLEIVFIHVYTFRFEKKTKQSGCWNQQIHSSLTLIEARTWLKIWILRGPNIGRIWKPFIEQQILDICLKWNPDWDFSELEPTWGYKNRCGSSSDDLDIFGMWGTASSPASNSPFLMGTQ